jgi:acetyl-CoA synthetase
MLCDVTPTAGSGSSAAPMTSSSRLELLGFGRSRLGAAVALRLIAFDQNLPKTKSGKIMRRLPKARELGITEGDLSTLEVGS